MRASLRALGSFFAELGIDFRHAIRSIRSRPGFAVVVVATMAIGIGSATGIFAFYAYFARPTIDAPGEERLVWIQSVTEDGSGPGTSFDDFRELETGTTDVLDRVAGWRLFPASMRATARTSMAWGHSINGGYFETFGARAELGRLIGPADDRPDAAPVVVLSHLTWRSQFDADPEIVGKSIEFNGRQRFTVVGVAAEGFQGEGLWSGVYVPIATTGALITQNREVLAIGRLREGVGVVRGDARLAALARAFDAARPLEEGTRQLRFAPTTQPAPELVADPLYAASRALLVAVSLLLVLACANVANLFLARGATRRRDLAVRAALGAGRLRLAGQLGIESLLLAFAGGALGLGFARVLLAAIERYLRFELPLSMGDWAAGTTLTLDEGELTLFFVAVACGSALLFGVAPMLQIARTHPATILRGDAAGGRSGARARRTLLVVQVALATTLLAVGGLLSRSLATTRALDLGYSPRGLSLATVFVPRERSVLPGGNARLQDELVRQVRELPGVDGAALVNTVPFAPGPATMKTVVGGERSEVATNVVGDGYFETLGVALVDGRSFVENDAPDGPHIAIVNRAAAERYWPGKPAVGERFELYDGGFESPSVAHEVVGVVADSHYAPATTRVDPLVYLPHSQHPKSRATILIRSRAPVEPELRRLLRERYADLAVVAVAPFEEQRKRGLATQRMNAELSTGVAVVGLAFSLLGIFGIASYTVAERKRDIGVRLAIGAQKSDVRRWALGSVARPVAWGLALGLPAALAAGELVRTLLVGIGRRDPATFLVVPLAVAATALVAAWFPAQQSTRIDPVRVLRDS